MTFPKLDIKNSKDLAMAKLALKGYIYSKELENESVLSKDFITSKLAKNIGLYAIKLIIKKFKK